MDIVDIVLARALSPQGQIESYANLAQAAVARANTAVSNIETITEQTQENNTLAEETIQSLSEAIEALNAADPMTASEVNSEIKKVSITKSANSGTAANTVDLTMTYPDNTTSTISDVVKMYKSTGTNEDGTMTQKAITSYMEQIASNSSGSGGNSSSSGTTNLGNENSGNIVVIGPDGNITSGTVTEHQIIEALIAAGNYTVEGALGLEVDYENLSNTRTQDAVGLSAGENFDQYIMYGGRVRCNVADNGEITAFEGDQNFASDGSNGQVMVYQPKFYYQRVPVKTTSGSTGKIILKDSILISPTELSGFKLHPLFQNGNEELEYVLLSAYEGGLYDTSESTYLTSDNTTINFNEDKLSSVAGVKPISGKTNSLSSINTEALAANRGPGWHITNLKAESAMQMLEMVEFGTMNGQTAIEKGVVSLTAYSTNGCSLTGSTASLGNSTGVAASTVNERGGSTYTYNTAGSRAISYRGVENPWGNLHRLVGGVNIVGNSASGGIPYVCSDFNYDLQSTSSNYASVGFALSNTTDWVSNMGYGSDNFDWVFMPARCENANSALPVGDNLWVTPNLNTTNICGIGGTWTSGDSAGPFYYVCDHSIVETILNTYGARLMFIPTRNETYLANITKWTTYIGG